MSIGEQRKRCEICGGDGFEELLITCTECKATTEHVYCMRKNRTEIPEKWFCEDCNKDDLNREENSQNPPQSRVVQGGNGSGYRRTQAVRTGKVKFIDAEEVIKLSSGSTAKLGSPTKSNMNYRPSISVTPESNPKGVLSMNPPVHGKIQVSAMSSQQANRTSKDKRVTFQPISNYKEHKSASIKTTKKVKTCNINMLLKAIDEREASGQKEKTCGTKADHLPTVGRKPEVECEERLVLATMPVHDSYRSYFPSEDEIWKGGFKFLDTAMPGKFFGGFKAQLPSRINRKVYDFSSTLPIILQVVLLPRDHVWGYLFQNDDPDLRDIALYFLPSANIERSKETYASLFELLESENSVMISCIGNVELLISTSKQLHEDSIDVAEGSIRGRFLWAIFRHSKDKIPRNNFHVSQKCISPIDMEVDMEGGQLIGKVDTVVAEKKECGKSVKTLSNAFESNFEQMRLTSEQTQSNFLSLFSEANNVLSACYSQNSSKSTGSRQELNIPPRFEERLRQKAICPDLQKNTTCGTTHWTPPPKGWIKLNIGASFKNEKLLTAGGSGVIRDETGQWICACSLHSDTILEAELWSIYQGLVLAWDKGYGKVVVESENLITVELLMKTRTAEDHNSIPVECCLNVIKRDWECKVVCIDRQGNLSAVWLANRFDEHQSGFTVFESPPDGLVPLLQFDSWGLCPPVNQSC